MWNKQFNLTVIPESDENIEVELRVIQGEKILATRLLVTPVEWEDAFEPASVDIEFDMTREADDQ